MRPRTRATFRHQEPSRPPVNLSRDWREVPPAEKIEIIQAMGFTPMFDPHQPDCPYRQGGPGYRCNCVPDPPYWSPPDDVCRHLHETWDERLERARARNRKLDTW